MANTLRWGVLSTSKFFRTKVLPALQQCRIARLTAVASREPAKAADLAAQHGIPTVHESYEALLADPDIDAVYIPLPNHLHVPWAIRAAQAGKHVLCEKPLSLNAADAEKLVAVRKETGVKIGEAFMVATHPQWLTVRNWIREGRIGPLRAVQGFFSYNNLDPSNIRNQADLGGGALMDIGCYPIFTTRFVSDAEPSRVLGLVERDPDFRTDRLTSAILDFGSFQATFMCSTQLVPYQRMHFFGSKGRIEVEIPFNAPPDRACRLFLDDGRDVFGSGITTTELPVLDQYTEEFDQFSAAVLEGREVPVPIESSVGNMRIIESIFYSAQEARWVSI